MLFGDDLSRQIQQQQYDIIAVLIIISNPALLSET